MEPLNLIKKYEPLVRSIAGGFRRKMPSTILYDDLLAAGMSGLWDAVRKYGDGGAVNFEWYVRVRVRGAILDELRAQDWLPRRMRSKAEESRGTDAYVPPPAVVRFDDLALWEQARVLGITSSGEVEALELSESKRLRAAVRQLLPREEYIVTHHYYYGVKFKDLAAELAISEPRISQIHAKAIQKLKAILLAVPA